MNDNNQREYANQWLLARDLCELMGYDSVASALHDLRGRRETEDRRSDWVERYHRRGNELSHELAVAMKWINPEDDNPQLYRWEDLMVTVSSWAEEMVELRNLQRIVGDATRAVISVGSDGLDRISYVTSDRGDKVTVIRGWELAEAVEESIDE